MDTRGNARVATQLGRPGGQRPKEAHPGVRSGAPTGSVSALCPPLRLGRPRPAGARGPDPGCASQHPSRREPRNQPRAGPQHPQRQGLQAPRAPLKQRGVPDPRRRTLRPQFPYLQSGARQQEAVGVSRVPSGHVGRPWVRAGGGAPGLRRLSGCTDPAPGPPPGRAVAAGSRAVAWAAAGPGAGTPRTHAPAAEPRGTGEQRGRPPAPRAREPRARAHPPGP